MNKTHQILIEARKLIADPETWDFGRGSRDKAGKLVGWLDKNAASFSTDSAVCIAAKGLPSWPPCGEALAALRAETGDDNGYNDVTALSLFNDHPDRTHAEVLDLFDRTIARLEKPGKDKIVGWPGFRNLERFQDHCRRLNTINRARGLDIGVRRHNKEAFEIRITRPSALGNVHLLRVKLWPDLAPSYDNFMWWIRDDLDALHKKWAEAERVDQRSRDER